MFEIESWWKDNIYWLMERSCFELIIGGEYGLFLSQKVDGKMIFTDYWKFLVLNISELRNTAFFWAKKLMERWYLLSLFGLFIIFHYLGNIVVRAVLLLAACKYFTKNHLKDLLSSIFYILIKAFLDGVNFFIIWYNCYHLRAFTFKYWWYDLQLNQ